MLSNINIDKSMNYDTIIGNEVGRKVSVYHYNI